MNGNAGDAVIIAGGGWTNAGPVGGYTLYTIGIVGVLMDQDITTTLL